jgi:hypothetical protein
LSSTFFNSVNATFAGGFSGVVTAKRVSQTSSAAITWQAIPPVGTLSSPQGDSITYSPPAPSNLEVPTSVAVTATLGTFQHNYKVGVFPAIWKLPSAAPNWGLLNVTGTSKPASFPATLEPNDYPQHDPIPNFDSYGWMVLPALLQKTGPDNLNPGNYLPTAGKGTFIGVKLQPGSPGTWQIQIRVDNDPNSTSPAFTGNVSCNNCGGGSSIAINGSTIVFTNVHVPLDQGGEVVLDGTLAIDEQASQAGTTATAASLQQCPKTWANLTGAAAVASLPCIAGTYNGVSPSGNGQCSVVINTASHSVSFTSEGTTETMPIPDNLTTGRVTLGFNPYDSSYGSVYPFHDQYAVALNTQPQTGPVSSVQRLLFTFGLQSSASVVISGFAYELDFSYSKASSATANPTVAKHCRIKLNT